MSGQGAFATTHWSLVAKASATDDLSGARLALAELCARYRPPICAYLRRAGHDVHAADDLAQAFFVRLLDKRDVVETADPRKGRFRAYLLGALEHFVANERAREHAQRRGGGRAAAPLDPVLLDAVVDAQARNPEQAYLHAWAHTLLARTRERLAAHYTATGRGELFEQLEEFLTAGTGRTPQAEVAARLGTSEGAVKVAVHRLRRRWGAMLREEVASTLSDETQVEDELRELLAALAPPGGNGL